MPAEWQTEQKASGGHAKAEAGLLLSQGSFLPFHLSLKLEADELRGEDKSRWTRGSAIRGRG
jgi:hypothetical protein